MCNELNAAHAAGGCARLARVSALATTCGVGELASLAGVAGAYAKHVPIVCISGAPQDRVNEATVQRFPS
jgi:TPP-dependent 2-oxoacid decarboxylase